MANTDTDIPPAQASNSNANDTNNPFRAANSSAAQSPSQSPPASTPSPNPNPNPISFSTSASTSTSNVTTQPGQPQAQAQTQQDPGVNVDPRVAALRAIFPDYDDLILISVLAEVGGDQDRAIDALLGMSDPEYKPDPSAPQVGAGGAGTTISQTELDEQLARHLMQEEQEAHQAAWQAQQDTRIRPARQGQGQGQAQYAPQGGQGGQGDTMAEIQQQLGKIAETGKKTFGNIFSKVKAKIQEMDQPRTGQSSSGVQPTWAGNTSAGYDPALYEQHVYQGQQQQQPQPPWNTRPQAQQPQQQYQAQAQQPAYYDPNPRNTSYPINSSQSPPITLQGPAVTGYDTAPEPSARSTSPPAAPRTPPPVNTPRPPATGSGPGSPGASLPFDSGAPPPPFASDTILTNRVFASKGKLGLLPKRPVALLRSQSPPAIQSQHSQQSDDTSELEYAENPFEEQKTTTRK
ncbi:hypothetical protein DXG03_004077 [Asterophora parasitica]|uniref:CUE domain-containing protein n=1 Tax=Asterophora parasitica TaxID=117018 RepID=A0A9P7GBF7_9AGAR|nr:hypothetical protein DXG03_004077 [Asterophora parasitica]